MTTTHRRRIKTGDMMIAAARIKAEAVGKGGDPSAGSELAESATTALSPPPQISIGSEIVPVEALGFPSPELCNTLENPSLITADASVARLHLLDRVGVLEMGLDAAETIRPQNNLKMMLARQLAALHGMSAPCWICSEWPTPGSRAHDDWLTRRRCGVSDSPLLKQALNPAVTG